MVVPLFEAKFQSLIEWTDKTHKQNLIQNYHCFNRVSSWTPPEYKSGTLLLQPAVSIGKSTSHITVGRHTQNCSS
jgi:hypothetical protein